MPGQPRYAAKRDAVEPEITEALDAIGASYRKLSDPKKPGLPDLLVGYRGVDFQFEVKSEGGRLSDDQRDYQDTWRGRRPEVVRCQRDVLEALGAILPPPRGMDCRG